MRIVVLCPHHAPDVAPTGEVMTRLIHELAARGHELDVVTALPWYLHHRVEPGWTGRLWRRERTEWGRITRVHPFPGGDKENLARRAVEFGALTGLATLVGLAGRRADVVMVMSPPLTLGAAGWISRLTRRGPLVFNVQDVYPDVAVDVGALSGRRVIAAMSGLERWTYRRSAAVTVLSDDLAANVRAKVGDATRVEVIPNFVDTDVIRPADRHNTYRDEFGLGDRTVVMYAGNLGYSQPVAEVFVGAARRLAHRDDLVFVINGGGSGRAEAVEAARGLPNVVFAPLQPRERLPEVLAAGDIHTVVLRVGVSRSSVPSKTYSILAASRPLLASVDAGSEVPRVVARSGGGVSVPPDDTAAVASAVERLADDPAGRRRMGAAGRAFVEGWASPAAVAEAYEALFEQLGAARGGN